MLGMPNIRVISGGLDMIVSHILYKVKDLDEAVKKYQEQGFVVEYGKEKKPYNALIYFSEGPYLELFHWSGMPRFFRRLLRLFGKGKVIDRLEQWENSEEGLIGVCIENHKDNLDKEIGILKEYGIKYFKIKGKRKDTKGRVLQGQSLFPYEMKIPFLMTQFSFVPMPKDFVHPNGTKKISSISFGTTEVMKPIINELCNDKCLKLFIGDGVKDLVYEFDKG
jgi:hypothetical protein